MQAYDIALIPLILALIELFKRVGLPVRYAPLAALALGITAGFLYLAPGDPAKAVLLGIVMGLSSVGLFSGTRNTIRNNAVSDKKEIPIK